MVWLAVLLILDSTPVQAARDIPKQSSTAATASIRGRITDQETGDAIPRALVTVYSLDRRETIETEADAEGRYAFTGLQSGRYAISAGPGQLRATHIGNHFGVPPGRLTMHPPELTLTPGEIHDRADIALVRALAIEGQVLDPSGEPMANVNVTAFNVRNGRESEQSTTDDRGMFRIFGLPSGPYRVCADPRAFGPAEDQSPERYSRTCAASAIADSEADIITLRREVSDIRISVQRRTTYTVSGTLTDATGSAASGHVDLISLDPNGRGTGTWAKDGLFTVSGLLPGRYSVRATIGAPSDPGDMRPAPDMEIGFVSIQVQAGDVAGVAVTTAKGARVAGRVGFEGGRPRSAPRMSVFVRDEGQMSRIYTSRPPLSAVGPDSRFVLSGLFGRNTLGVQNVPEGWVIKAIRYKGADITDLPTTFTSSSDPGSLEITLTNHVANLSAHVLDADGRTVTDCSILLFPADPARWTTAASEPWTQKVQGDTIQIAPRRAGDYLVVAVSLEDYAWLPRDVSRLEKLATAARRITLAEGDKRTVDLTLVDMEIIR
jgi:hypothetical protein